MNHSALNGVVASSRVSAVPRASGNLDKGTLFHHQYQDTSYNNLLKLKSQKLPKSSLSLKLILKRQV